MAENIFNKYHIICHISVGICKYKFLSIYFTHYIDIYLTVLYILIHIDILDSKRSEEAINFTMMVFFLFV